MLATIHCDSNATALIRLLDLGVSPMLLSSGLNLLVSQRLLRSLCEHCKAPAHLSDSQSPEIPPEGLRPREHLRGGGLRALQRTGYYGSTAICDLMVVDDSRKAEKVAKSQSLIDKLRSEGARAQSRPPQQTGLKKVVAGITSLDPSNEWSDPRYDVLNAILAGALFVSAAPSA